MKTYFKHVLQKFSFYFTLLKHAGPKHFQKCSILLGNIFKRVSKYSSATVGTCKFFWKNVFFIIVDYPARGRRC